MLDEEKLSNKLAILEQWIGAIAEGHHELTAKGAQVFRAILEQSRVEAVALESAALGREIASGLSELNTARANVAAATIELQEAGNVLAFRRPQPRSATPT
jgi:hypothetical protein